MNKNILNKILPHVIAILIFLVASVVFNSPALEGKILDQYDVFGWQGMAKSSYDYRASHGYYPWWNPTAFSGMPNYTILFIPSESNYPDITSFLKLWLPDPIAPFFLACICFYILALAFRFKPIIGIITGLAFAFCSYNAVNISVGHLGKVYAIAYMPLLLAGIVLIYAKKYWLGLAVTTYGAFTELVASHPQISYYFFLAVGLITLAYLINWIKNKEFKHIGISFCLISIGAIVGLMACAISLLVLRDYTKTTMRGGKNIEVNGDKVVSTTTKGLDTSYAFQYSFSKIEPLVMLMPGALGGSSMDRVDEDTRVVEKLTNAGIPEASAMQVAQSLPKYWGGLESSGGINYVGAIIFLLALLGFVTVSHPAKWGLLAAAVLGIFITMGKYLPGFNLLLFHNLPLFNKFRSPNMASAIPDLILPIMAGFAMQQLFFDNGIEYLKNNFRKILYTFGGLVALLGILYLVMNYSSPITDPQILSTDWDKSGSGKIGKLMLSGLKEDRRAMFGGQILRTIGFMLLILAALWLYMKKYVKPVILLSVLGIINFADLVAIDKTYLNEEKYISKDEAPLETATKSAIDEQILKDTTLGYRVFNAGPERFSASDYKINMYHRSVGGYSATKMRKYQDIIERYLYSMPNQQILNMLNVKYIVATNQQDGQQNLYPVNTNFGAAWFVKNIKFVNDNVEEIQSLGSTNLKDTVVIQKSNGANLQQPQWDTSASIRLTKYAFDTLVYESSAAAPQYAVFSEVHYPKGWNVYIDGKQVDHNNVNYILRGLPVPAGKHKIEFIFAPAIVKTGIMLAETGYFLVVLITLGGLFMNYWQTRKKNNKPGVEKG